MKIKKQGVIRSAVAEMGAFDICPTHLVELEIGYQESVRIRVNKREFDHIRDAMVGSRLPTVKITIEI